MRSVRRGRRTGSRTRVDERVRFSVGNDLADRLRGRRGREQRVEQRVISTWDDADEWSVEDWREQGRSEEDGVEASRQGEVVRGRHARLEDVGHDERGACATREAERQGVMTEEGERRGRTLEGKENVHLESTEVRSGQDGHQVKAIENDPGSDISICTREEETSKSAEAGESELRGGTHKGNDFLLMYDFLVE